jgi:hypothetical protein
VPVVSATTARSMMMDKLILENLQDSARSEGCTTDDDDDDISCSSGEEVLQIVILGGGMDTKAYRLNVPPSKNKNSSNINIKWFEVDHSDIIEYKERELGHHFDVDAPTTTDGTSTGIVIPGGDLDLTRIKLDLHLENDAEHLHTILQENGFDPDARIIYVMEGLLFYMDSNAIRCIFAAIMQKQQQQHRENNDKAVVEVVVVVVVVLSMLDKSMLDYIRGSDFEAQADAPTVEKYRSLFKTDLSHLKDLLLATNNNTTSMSWNIVQETPLTPIGCDEMDLGVTVPPSVQPGTEVVVVLKIQAF